MSNGPLRLHFEPDAVERAEIAQGLGLESLPSFSAEVQVRPWLDGAEIDGRFEAVVGQLCGVSLEAFEQPLSGHFDIKVLPPGSPNAAPEDEPEVEVTFDLETPDPPEMLDGEDIDITGYLLEQLALEVDPFPRKPGAQFDYVPPPADDSPFNVLKQLKDKKD